MSDPLPPNDPVTPPPGSIPPGATPPPPIDYGTPATAGGVFNAPPPPGAPVVDPNARTWGMISHLSALAGYVIPFGNIIGPLVVWQMKKTEIPFAADQAKEALNFNITLTILIVICLALMCVVVGFFLLPVVGIGGLVLMILAAVAANKGEYYRYPYIFRFVK